MVTMNESPKAKTLYRCGKEDIDLERAVKGMPGFLKIPVGLKGTLKYAKFGDNKEYMIMISRQTDGSLSPAGHNTSLTVTSYSDKLNREVAEEFERKLGISLDLDPPKGMENILELMNHAFSEKRS